MTPSLTDQIGRDVLGPLLHGWMFGLRQHMAYLNDGQTRFLLCARAGVRIGRLYQTAFPDDACDMDLFWISRLSVAKGTWARKPAPAAALIAREFRFNDVGAAAKALLRHCPDRLRRARTAPSKPGADFADWLKSKDSAARVVRTYLTECGAALDAYIAETVQHAPRAVLIDSGWSATTQALLAGAYPDVAWRGLYYGRAFGETSDRSVAPWAAGVMFERDAYDPSVPESAMLLCRHLLEAVLEPGGPSVEEIPAGPFTDITAPMIAANGAAPDAAQDALFLAAEAYIADNAVLGLTTITARRQQAARDLARILAEPTREDAQALSIKDRVDDFGKSLRKSALTAPTADGFPEQRIAGALWPQGQAALEYTGALAKDAQRRLSGQMTAAQYFDPMATEHQESAKPPSTVAIITRTKNRPVLLRRAAESVARQTWPHYIWVVVNDGGDEQAVREVIEDSAVDRRRVVLAHNPDSLGMEAASNAGARAVDSAYLHIHDDDDSLDPTFYERMVGFLDSPAGARYGGAISGSLYVSEEIQGDRVIEHGRWPYKDWVRSVHIAEMAAANVFAPIAFVYRRSVYDAVGGYDESLPVLGDWRFNLDVLVQADIGVVPEPLAFYHHRDQDAPASMGVYANSVLGGRSKHEEFAAVVRNGFFRDHMGDAAGAAMLIGYLQTDLRPRFPHGQAGAGPATGGAGPETDAADRLRAIAAINAASRSRRGWRRAATLPPDADWIAVSAALKCLKAPIPAPDDFSERAYTAQNPDVAATLGPDCCGAYDHYLRFGRAEGRMRPNR